MSYFAFTLIHQYGSAAAFVLLALEYVGLPVPGEPIMSMLGYLSPNNIISFLTTLIFCVSGTFIGSMAAYFIGLKIGEPIIIALGRILHISQEKIDTIKQRFEKNQVSLIIISRFIPGFRHIIPYLSGTVKIKVQRYIILNLISCFAWCSTFLISGMLFKNLWQSFDGIVRIISLSILALLIILYIIFKIIKYKKRIKDNN